MTTTNPDCLFCKMVAGTIKADVVHQTDHALAFNDIAPQAPTHVLVIPKTHVTSMAYVTDTDTDHYVLQAVRETAKKLNLTDYRVVMNTGAAAGQSVFHWHCHILAGRPLQWPPG